MARQTVTSAFPFGTGVVNETGARQDVVAGTVVNETSGGASTYNITVAVVSTTTTAVNKTASLHQTVAATSTTTTTVNKTASLHKTISAVSTTITTVNAAGPGAHTYNKTISAVSTTTTAVNDTPSFVPHTYNKTVSVVSTTTTTPSKAATLNKTVSVVSTTITAWGNAALKNVTVAATATSTLSLSRLGTVTYPETLGIVSTSTTTVLAAAHLLVHSQAPASLYVLGSYIGPPNGTPSPDAPSSFYGNPGSSGPSTTPSSFYGSGENTAQGDTPAPSSFYQGGN